MLVEFLPDLLTTFLSIVSGIVVGFSLGLMGGGGSVLAVPLLLYVVGIKDMHMAIGTSALAIGIIAAINLLNKRKNNNLKLKQGLSFALPGIAGTLIGSQLGLLTPAENLIVFFAVFMGIIGVIMMKRPHTSTQTSSNSRLVLFRKNSSLYGVAVGVLAGYFGIGGGFLIVPTMMYSGGLNIIQAIGTSMIPVSSFGLVTAGRYFVDGNVDFVIAMLFVMGGIIGTRIGIKTLEKIPKQNVVKIFSVMLFGVAAYIVIRTFLL
ncbi:sulfite exporter TauE/SafE family protein [Nitrosopumilus piranensis]|uniref:Probable membrane transporter protein n=1 Tax=Nitrosopumilus piranensis TaxID=1582439 RepID=A0A0C5BUU3_9ARCH|nr:sulfite exporter TauE/SafE family protein [Nitrosopumilus piranensis]AJM92006.1 putative permease [Nitrosopumilus piranensis]